MKLWFWDLETHKWDQPLCAVAVSEAGDVERFVGSDCLERMWEHMAHARGTYCAHYGGGFDVPLLLNVHRIKKIILTGSNILTAEESRDLKLRDTFPWFLCSLAKVGKAIGMEKWDVDRSNIAIMSQKEMADYCERDATIGLRGTQAAKAFLEEQGAENAWTAGTSAVNILKAVEPQSWGQLRRHQNPAMLVQECIESRAIRGGRVECWWKGVAPLVYSYDFKSSYPARYVNRPLGLGLKKHTGGSGSPKRGMHRIRYTWPHRHLVPPALDSGTLAGCGPIECWAVDDEVEQIEACGCKVEKLYGWTCDVELPIGQVFAQTLYAAKESTGPNGFFSKVWLNSLHGKFSERTLRESYTAWRPKEYADTREPELRGSWWSYDEISQDKDGNAPAWAQPVAAAQILGRARVALWRVINALQRGGYEVYYCDTDSIHTNCPPEKMAELGIVLGKNMGELALEAGPCNGYYLGPKAYLLIDRKGEIVKSALKGVPLKSYRDAVYDADSKGQLRYRQARSEQREKGSDLRLDVFVRALKDQAGARCLKEGVSSFLSGLSWEQHTTNGKTEKRAKESWGRKELVRTIKPVSKGKTFSPAGNRWSYLTTVELSALAVARAMPILSARYREKDPSVQGFLQPYVTVGPYTTSLNADGFLWFKRLQIEDFEAENAEYQTGE